jgi:hypothetical protein
VSENTDFHTTNGNIFELSLAIRNGALTNFSSVCGVSKLDFASAEEFPGPTAS